MPKLRNGTGEVTLGMIPSTRGSLRLSKDKMWEVSLSVNGYELRSVAVYNEADAEYCCQKIREALRIPAAYVTPAAKCPVCGYQATVASEGAYGVTVGNEIQRAPLAGDVSICLECAAVNIYTDSAGNLRRPTAEELITIANDERIRSAVNKVVQARRRKLGF